MRRLVTLGFLLMLAHALLIGAAKVLGYQQPLAPAITHNHLTDCALPCWAGIQIGATEWAEGNERIRQTYADHDVIDQSVNPSILASGQNTFSSYELWFANRQNHDEQTRVALNTAGTNITSPTIEGIILTAVKTSRLPSILDLSALYGAPICVVQNAGISNTSLKVMFLPNNDPDQRVTAQILNRGSGWHAPVYEIRLVTNFPDNCDNWRGFTNLTKHRRR